MNKVLELISKEEMNQYSLDYIENPDYGNWRVEKDFCQALGAYCRKYKPKKVIEFGTGLTTEILAHEIGQGNVQEVISVDHLNDFPGHPREKLSRLEAGKNISYVVGSIGLHYLAGKMLQFYAWDKSNDNLFKNADLVLVDGPPYFFNGREAALYKIFGYLKKGGVLFLDDSRRQDKELTFLKRWKNYYGENVDVFWDLDNFKKGLGVVIKNDDSKPFHASSITERLNCFKLTSRQALANSIVGSVYRKVLGKG